DLDAARDRFEEALRIGRELGDRRCVGGALRGLGDAARASGDMPLAETHYRESLQAMSEAGDKAGVGVALRGLGVVAGPTGQHERAVLLLRAAERLLASIGSRSAREAGERLEEVRQAAPERWEGWYRRAEGMATDEAVQYALAPDEFLGRHGGQSTG